METAWVRRVLVVEDQPAMRALLCDMLAHREFEPTGAADAAEATTAFAATDPDVLLTDIDLGTRPSGVELATMLTGLAPHLAVVFLSSFPRAAAGAGRLGPAGAVFVSKLDVTSADVVVEAIEAALAEAIPPAPTSPRPSPLAGLTRRQIDVLALVARGWSNAQIARERGTTTRAVERAVSRIFERLALGSDPATNPRVRASALYLAEFGSAP
ncbi:response regulator [Microbacterium sp. Bi128]|uniref:LuxR family transcriptional regulator n=1 Tax=Microbacterium sp. Bi128 TaxID=2821115 RepID=UPI001D89969A|nr:response regulator [Microbacterium sp. Bi128]CAH0174239.1 Response regulator protein VraR [Microbacterium sp. Bi128]